MKLLEYEAKSILSQFKIPVPGSSIIDNNNSTKPSIPFVLKSQVPIGGRGKAGGIQIIKSNKDVDTTISNLFKLDIRGYTPDTLLAEELLNIKREYYISIIIDRSSSSIQLIVNVNGGVEVEENAVDSFWKKTVDKNSDWDDIGQQLADYYNLAEQTFVLQDLVENLYKCFVKNDATLIEINPLVLTEDNKIMAGDCKMELDDSASFRHEWNFEQKQTEVNFVTLNEHGTIATIANGAGLAMATVDAVADAGMTPANFLDIGGGANTETVLTALTKIMEYSAVKAIVINIFAGITRSDEVARAIIAAKKEIPHLPKLYIRIAGTNYDEAKQLLSEQGIDMLSTLEQCITAAKKDLI